tara:strand:- start:301 stop:465 length:165 start_codon:yes stop_codon:yes gene_type:complete
MREHGSLPSDDLASRKIYFQATVILMLLWALVAAITVLSLEVEDFKNGKGILTV